MKIFAVFNHPSNGLQQHQKEVQSAHLQLGTSYELEQASVGPFFSTVALTGTQAASTPSTSTSSTKHGALLTYTQCPVSGTINTKGAVHGQTI